MTITGGTGALGRIVAAWLSEVSSARGLTLLGRRGSASPAGMETSHGVVTVESCDTSRREDARLVLAAQGSAPGSGIVLSGGVLADATLPKQTPGLMRMAFGPKMVSTALAREALWAAPLAAMPLFSSSASLLGSPGQASYAAANSALDGQAWALQNEGLPSMSIQWGPWSGRGMASREKGTAQRMAAIGIGFLDPVQGLRALARIAAGQGLAGQRPAASAVVLMQWERYHAWARGVLPMVSVLAAGRSPAAAKTAAIQMGLGRQGRPITQPVAPSAPDRAPGVAELTESILSVARPMLPSQEDMTEETPFVQAGLDSLASVELRDALERFLGISLPVTVLYDFPSVLQLARHVHKLRSSGAAESILPSRSILPESGQRRDSVAGKSPALGVHLANAACTVPSPGDGFAGMEVTRSSAVVPLSRWDNFSQAISRDGLGTHFGRFLDVDCGEFDAAAFSVSGSEALAMDPQQRMLLEHAHQIVVSGPRWIREAHNSTGVFLGIWPADYHDMVIEFCADHAPHNATGGSISVAAGRLSFTFGLNGPCASIDTACSASLIATHLGRSSVATAECRAAVACGVSLVFSPTRSRLLSAAGMLSPSGNCKALDVSADGYARGEAVACALILSSAYPAQAPSALLPGSAANQDGRSSSLTAPHGPSQQDVIRLACSSAGRDPSKDLGAVEMHGTGTALGDPIEVGALLAAAQGRRAPVAVGGPPLALQAPKSLFAHPEAAAGMVGVLSAASMLIGRRALAVRHLRQVNPHIEQFLPSPAAGAQPLLLAARQPCAFVNGRADSVGVSCADSSCRRQSRRCVLGQCLLSGLSPVGKPAFTP